MFSAAASSSQIEKYFVRLNWNNTSVIFAFEILEIELKCKILEKSGTFILELLKENGSEEGKNAKFSACGGLGSKKGVLKPLI